MLSSVVATFPGWPRLLQWTCTGCGSPGAVRVRGERRLHHWRDAATVVEAAVGERPRARVAAPRTICGAVSESRRGCWARGALFGQHPAALIDARAGDLRVDVDAFRRHE